jgi:Replication-relaxation
MPPSPSPLLLAQRRARFRREAPQPVRLTGDDLALIRHIAKHRFLRSPHLLQLMPHRSEKKLIERLGTLYHNGFLDRPRAQLDYYATAGSSPMVYALGNRGAHLLAEIDGADPGSVDWTWKNRSAGRVFLAHTLMTADVMVAVECALRTRPDVLLIEPHHILTHAPEPTRLADNPFKFKVHTHQAGAIAELSVIPDRVFGLDFTVERKRKYFFLEADRATMPVMRSSLLQTSIYRKFLAYAAGGGATNCFGKQLGIGSFRVLTVTTSAERTATMIDAVRQATRESGSRQFLRRVHPRMAVRQRRSCAS